MSGLRIEGEALKFNRIGYRPAVHRVSALDSELIYKKALQDSSNKDEVDLGPRFYKKYKNSKKRNLNKRILKNKNTSMQLDLSPNPYLTFVILGFIVLCLYLILSHSIENFDNYRGASFTFQY